MQDERCTRCGSAACSEKQQIATVTPIVARCADRCRLSCVVQPHRRNRAEAPSRIGSGGVEWRRSPSSCPCWCRPATTLSIRRAIIPYWKAPCGCAVDTLSRSHQPIFSLTPPSRCLRPPPRLNGRRYSFELASAPLIGLLKLWRNGAFTHYGFGRAVFLGHFSLKRGRVPSRRVRRCCPRKQVPTAISGASCSAARKSTSNRCIKINAPQPMRRVRCSAYQSLTFVKQYFYHATNI
jgi:hypothetical protein